MQVVSDAPSGPFASLARPPQPGGAHRVPLRPLAGPRAICVGFNKTGTTTMGVCFEALGLNPVAEPQSRFFDYVALSETIFEQKKYEPLLQAASYFRSFQDRPWNIWAMYQQLDVRFPGSRFILTEREPESWWQSVEQWLTVTHRGDARKLQRYLHHLKVRRLEKGAFIAAYARHNRAVKSYFARRSNSLLVMNFEAGDQWNKLCDFLGLPVPDRPFPHANRQMQSP